MGRRRERNHFRMERQRRRGSVFRRTEHSVFSHDALRIGEGVAEGGGAALPVLLFSSVTSDVPPPPRPAG